MTRALTEFWHNPSSVHRAGQRARGEVELARERVAALVGARPREITFTSGGSESIDLAIRGTLARTQRRVVVTTRVEHAAVRELCEELEKTGAAEVRWLPLDGQGVVDVAGSAAMIDGACAILSVQWANNETGAIQPVMEMSRLARAAGAAFHVDATQWVGKYPATVAEGPEGSWCDLMTFSAHKFHGPKGVGVLWARSGMGLRPRLVGTQELGRRGGTENVPGIVGAGVAAVEAVEWLKDASGRERVGALRDRFEMLVMEGVKHGRDARATQGQGQRQSPVVNGPRGEGKRLWNTTNIGFPRLEAEALLMLLSEAGVCASAGAACSSGSLEPSPVLLAMGISPEVAHGSVRFSLGRETTREEVEEAAGIVLRCVERLRG